MEINYDELFGLESENTEEVADPPAEETTDTVEETADTEETAGEKESEPAEQTVEQTKEERAAHAAARRKAEEDARVSKGVDDAIASLGLVNPYTGKAVTNKAEFEEYGKSVGKEKEDAFLDKTGLTKEELKSYVDGLPEMQQAKRMQADMELQKQKTALDAAIAEVTKIDPAIKTLDDLQKLPNYGEIYDKAMRGYTLADAYLVVNRDKLTQKASAAAKQAALNNLGKDHMKPTTSRGEGQIDVPADVMENYRLLNPKATDAEIREHYNKHHKKG